MARKMRKIDELVNAKETLETYCQSLEECEGCAFDQSGVCRVGCPPVWGDKAVCVEIPEDEPKVEVEEDEPESSVKGRCDVLLDAMKAVCSDRNLRYGEPEDNFGVIAGLWSAYLNAGMPEGACKYDLGARQVADMMILFKVGRMATAMEDRRDTYVDIAGYAACAGGMCDE